MYEKLRINVSDLTDEIRDKITFSIGTYMVLGIVAAGMYPLGTDGESFDTALLSSFNSDSITAKRRKRKIPFSDT